MNKCHYYLSSGLWEAAKCYFDNDGKLFNTYFWSAAVVPHQISFGSHLIATPWHQSWAVLNLLEACLGTKPENHTAVFTANDICTLRNEIDFQFILRNYCHDPFVQKLFADFTKIYGDPTGSLSSPEKNDNFVSFLISLFNNNPSTVHHVVRHLYQRASKLLPLLEFSKEDCFELARVYLACGHPSITSVSSVPTLLADQRGACFVLLLLAGNHFEYLKKVQEIAKSAYLESSTSRFEKLIKSDISLVDALYGMILSQKNFLLELLDFMCLHLQELQAPVESVHLPSFLWPLLLLRIWKKSGGLIKNTSDDLLFLIDRTKASIKDKVILQISFVLEWFISFCKWSEKQGSLEKKSLNEVRNHSVLYLISNTSHLARADWQQVRELLEQGGQNSSNCWDLRLFDGYCAIYLVLNALISGHDVAAAGSVGVFTFDNISEADDILSSMYQEEVTSGLKLAANLVRQLVPLTFRLEILELIFACLFFTWDDVKNFIVVNELDVMSSMTGRGFIATKHVFRDIIHLLKDCLDELEKETKLDSEMDASVPCSIKQNQWENRLDRLSESVSEAFWRLQLVTEPDFVGARYQLPHGCGHDPHYFTNDWLVTVDGWLDAGGESASAATKQKRRPASQSQSQSQSQAVAGQGNESNTSLSGGEEPVAGEEWIKREMGPGLMHHMLASDWSMVVRCLAQADLLNAEHIIQVNIQIYAKLLII